MAVWGFADLHTHPASHLGFGAREGSGFKTGIFWGSPGLNANTAQLSTDLPECNGIHTIGWDHGPNINPLVTVKSRGDVLVKIAEISHIPHGFRGAPGFADWPVARSIMHQQMHITWIRRAYQGGLRLLFASVTDNEVLAMFWHRYFSAPPPEHDPNYDYESACKQFEFIQQMASQNSGWMEIARTPAQARQIIGENRLAVVLSLEMDSLTVEQMVALKDEFGVSHVTPIHLINNTFGGVAVYQNLFNTSNRFTNGSYFEVNSNETTNFRLTRPDYLHYHTNDLLKSGAVEPLPISDAEYHALGYPETGGHSNRLGLDVSRMKMLMRHGFMIDLAHMSDRSQEQTLALAESLHYPVMNSHTGMRQDSGGPTGSERDMRRSMVTRIARLGGVLGLGTARDEEVISDNPIQTWISHYLDAMSLMGQRGVALGTDMNGFAPQIPFGGSPNSVTYPITLGRRMATPEALSSVLSLGQQRVGSRRYNFSADGIAQYGMLPDFLQAVHQKLTATGQDADALLRPMFNTAEDTIRMWEQTEEAARQFSVSTKPAGTIPLNSYWHAGRADNFTSASSSGRRDALAAGYSWVRTEGYVFSATGTGRVPLKLYWKNGTADNYTTASPTGGATALGAGYQNIRTEGYVSSTQRPGMVAQSQFWMDNPRNDHFLTASKKGKDDAASSGYTFVFEDGFIYPYAVALRAHNGMYFSAEGGGGGRLQAVSPHIREHETFQVIYLGSGRIALRTHVGYYLSATNGGGLDVTARGLEPREWETFNLMVVDGTRVAIKTLNNSFFLAAEGGGGGLVMANRTTRDIWETFEWIAV